ncbi:unnamed protein product (mitochondrion) [Plasmodiophora brassicae]|uniref:G domain-containing protein n=1 Tax=Plasmodiophora brassicae TaxID=37360 RepID=A0A0G4IND6_PLABS|nr:hypothetical protein PBRA_005284 [Plasmodiophora brassicae]SPQ95344.1 unnamed protein product [Plasmodiophora brassicae]
MTALFKSFISTSSRKSTSAAPTKRLSAATRATTPSVVVRRLPPTSPTTPVSGRVVVLGCGGSGKTTLFRQMSAQSWTSLDLQSMTTVIHGIIAIAIKTLVSGAARLHAQRPDLGTAIMSGTPVARSANYVMTQLRDDDVLGSRAARHIARLWADPAIRRTFDLRVRFGINVPDSTPYFLSRIGAIADPSYVPSSQDCLYGVVRSTGIQESTMPTSFGSVVQIIDVGGRRHERRKWSKVMHDVLAVVYVVSIGDFDAVCEEDGVTNRLMESLAVFEHIARTQPVPIVLVLTKTDQLQAALNRTRVTDLFPSYHGDPRDVNRAVAFFKALFLSKITRPGPICQHCTVLQCNATDRQSTAASVRTIRDIVDRQVAIRNENAALSRSSSSSSRAWRPSSRGA